MPCEACHGRRLVVKTINPLSLATFTDFYLDSTHTLPSTRKC